MAASGISDNQWSSSMKRLVYLLNSSGESPVFFKTKLQEAKINLRSQHSKVNDSLK
ncbi:hypothetical protein RRG08_011289 [Elysia crispata]|uniref:Uncharacterized protein n=1 Tax=Elysia crispata TaxID=231223 RepID=A0AAE1DJ20_9GAST|nr:hypothetical protein RRG08_011289 [Elysia crispata]